MGKKTEIAILATDGATGRSHPGIMSIGGLIVSGEGDVTDVFHVPLNRRGTNYEAEYHALIHGLELAREKGYKKIRIFVDIEVICHQVNGDYACHKPHLKPLHHRVMSILKSDFDGFSMGWHKRSSFLATKADYMSKNNQLDKYLGLRFLRSQLP